MERDSDAMFLGAVLRRARVAAGEWSEHVRRNGGSFPQFFVTEAPEIVAKERQMSDMLRCEALPRGASQELIMKVAKERWAQ